MEDEPPAASTGMADADNRPRERNRTDGDLMPNPRRATQPQRHFGPDDLAGLERAERRKLAQVLLTDAGSRVVEVNQPVAYDEFILETRPLWRPRRVRVRVADRIVRQDDLDRLAEAVRTAGEAEGVLFAPLGVDGQLHPAATVMVVDAESLIARMERCTSIAWPDRRPVPAYERVAAQRDLERDAFLLDPVGLRWLPTLALNELPAELAGRDLVPDVLFERLAFRLLTSTLRFGGTRHGEAARGQRLPDAVLSWGSGPPVAALLDCKATADGYTMDSDHYLRFLGYVNSLRGQIEAAGDDLRYVVVLSSSFTGTVGAHHPFRARADAMRQDTGLQLVYLRAEDLARTATSVESRELSPDERESLNWSSVLDHGIVTGEHLDTMLEG